MGRKGSYTLEAAWVVSFYLFMAAAAMQTGIDLYQEIVEEALTDSSDPESTKDFYRVTMMKKLGEQVKEE